MGESPRYWEWWGNSSPNFSCSNITSATNDGLWAGRFFFRFIDQLCSELTTLAMTTIMTRVGHRQIKDHLSHKWVEWVGQHLLLYIQPEISFISFLQVLFKATLPSITMYRRDFSQNETDAHETAESAPYLTPCICFDNNEERWTW